MPSMNTATWTATARSEAAPEAVLAALVDPDAIARWAPVTFEIEDDPTSLRSVNRLRPGTRTRVSGKLGGVRVGFDVEVQRADEQQLRLRALGPVEMDVAYDISPEADGTAVSASVSLARGRGLVARLMTEATAGLLRAGALSQAVNRIAAAA
jgi:uncharacterized protein YndB with AHSA1/START domain